MSVIKIHTTTSTNDLLKEMCRQNDVENFTVVWALHQTGGRGQRGNVWLDEEGKNLTFSMLIKLNDFEIQRQFELNQVISLAILEVLQTYLPQVQIKWPNDILADSQKISGILIENTLQGNLIKHSIVGIGLNVNQTEFDASVSHASSIKNILKKNTDLESLLTELVGTIQRKIKILEDKNLYQLQKNYTENLIGWQEYKWYSRPNESPFEGKIVDVLPNGQLVIETKEKQKIVFGFQEVKLQY